MKSDVPQSFLRSADDGREHTIKDFLARPVPLQNFEWTVSDSKYSILQQYVFPDVFLNQSLYVEKLSGFLGFRADIKVRLQVNAQPFQAGRLMMAYIPYDKYLNNYASYYLLGTAQSTVSISGCPRVDLDISQSTEMDMLIPYCSPNSHFNLATGEGYYGRLVILVYSPLVDVASNGHIDCTIWMNLENIDLAYPTGTAMVTSSINAQVGNEEVKTESYRSIAQDVGKVAKFLGSIPSIPVLSSIVQPTAWAADNLASLLKFFGYSKLQSTNVPEWIKQTPTHFMPNYNGVDMSHSLSLEAMQSIELMPSMVGNDVDEMAIQHVVSNPNYYQSFTWDTTMAAGTQLYDNSVTPASYYVAGSGATLQPTQLLYVAATFAYWRGSIDYTFKFVKTKFHSGRVRIFFQPGAAVFTPAKSNYNYSQVVDLKTDTDVVFRVPYVATRPWSSVYNSTGAGFVYSATGMVYVEVLNELVATSTVSNTIDVLVEVSAGPDFELASPGSSFLHPLAAPSQSTSAFARLRGKISAQVGQAPPQEIEQSSINKDQLGNDPLIPNWENNLYTIGEKVTSVRQLIKRQQRVASMADGSNLTINPWRFVFGSSSNTDSSMGYLDYFAHLYAFYRGGVNIKLIPSTSGVATILFNQNVSSDYPLQSSITGAVTFPSTTGMIKQPILTTLEGVIDLSIPYYSKFHMCPVTDRSVTFVNLQLGLQPAGMILVQGLSGSVDLYRGATDAFQFGFLIGAPPCIGE